MMDMGSNRGMRDDPHSSLVISKVDAEIFGLSQAFCLEDISFVDKFL